MYTSTNSSYTSSVASDPQSPHSPYQHPQPTSSLSLNSRRGPMPFKYPRFYASPLDEGTDSTPLQVYGYEQREPSIYGKPPKLLRRVSHALGDIREDMTLQLDPLKRRSTIFFETPLSPASPEVPMTSEGPRSRPMSIISYDAIAAPSRRLSQRLTRRLSVFSSRGKPTGNAGASISTPNLIGSSTQYGNRSQASFI